MSTTVNLGPRSPFAADRLYSPADAAQALQASYEVSADDEAQLEPTVDASTVLALDALQRSFDQHLAA